MVPDNAAGIDPKNNPDALYPWKEVMKSVKIVTKADKRKEEHVSHNSKKRRQLGEKAGPNLNAMTIIQRAYCEAKERKRDDSGAKKI